MYAIALKMLMGDRGKYLGIIMGGPINVLEAKYQKILLTLSKYEGIYKNINVFIISQRFS
jgi:hypothetical protein